MVDERLYCVNGQHIINGQEMLYSPGRKAFYCGDDCVKESEIMHMLRTGGVARTTFRLVSRDEALMLLRSDGIEAKVNTD